MGESFDAAELECMHPDCDRTVKSHRWGKTKATGWFFSRDDTQVWCPDHLPAWVESWRERNRRKT